MKKFEGKKLLILGEGSIDRQVSDYVYPLGCELYWYLDRPVVNKEQETKYKDVHEATSFDEEEIFKYAKKHKIDAVMPVIREEIFELARRLNNRLGNSFFHTENQWNKLVNKKAFKDLAKSYLIPTPKVYFLGGLTKAFLLPLVRFKYPLIVKPIDSAGCRGLTIVRHKKDLFKAILKGYKVSPSHKIVIEELLEGFEFSLTYVVQDNKAKLVYMGDRFSFESSLKIYQPFSVIAPSSSIDLFLNEYDDKFQKLIKDLKLNNCTLFFQGVNKDNKLYFFEAGLRPEATETYLLTEKVSNQSFLNFLVDNLLKVPSTYDVTKEDPYLGDFTYASYLPFIKEGKIDKILNQYSVQTSNTVYFEIFSFPGQEIKNGPMYSNLAYSTLFKLKNRNDVIPEIKKSIKDYDVLDKDGNSLLLKLDLDSLIK